MCTISQARKIVIITWIAAFLLGIPMMFTQVRAFSIYTRCFFNKNFLIFSIFIKYFDPELQSRFTKSEIHLKLTWNNEINYEIIFYFYSFLRLFLFLMFTIICKKQLIFYYLHFKSYIQYIKKIWFQLEEYLSAFHFEPIFKEDL